MPSGLFRLGYRAAIDDARAAAPLQIHARRIGDDCIVTVTAFGAVDVRVDVIDVRGTIVMTIDDDRRALGPREITLPTRSLPSGFYLLRATSGGGGAVTRFAVSK